MLKAAIANAFYGAPTRKWEHARDRALKAWQHQCAWGHLEADVAAEDDCDTQQEGREGYDRLTGPELAGVDAIATAVRVAVRVDMTIHNLVWRLPGVRPPNRSSHALVV